MFRFIFLILLALWSAVMTTAQLPLDERRFADSLTDVIKNETNDSIKARVNYLLTYYWLPRDTAKARVCLEEGKRLSRQYPYMRALAHAHEAQFYYNTDLEKSEAAYRRAEEGLRSFKNKETYMIRSNIWQNIGVIYQRKNDDRTFIELVLNKAIPLAKMAGDSAVMASQYVGVGVAFMNTEQFEKASVYLELAIHILRSIHTQPSRLVAAYNRAGENYIHLKQYDKAKNVLDSVRIILQPHPESDLWSGYYLVEGMYFHHLQRYHLALNSFDKGIELANGPNKEFKIQELQFLKLKSMIAVKQYAEAKKLLTALAADEAVMGLDENRLGVYEGLAEANAGLGNTGEAYQWQKKYSGLRDSIHKSQLQKDINVLEQRYRKAENEKEISALRDRNKQVMLEGKNHRLLMLLLGGLCIFLLLVAFFAIWYYRNNKKLSAQRMKEVAQQQQLAVTHALLEGEERERKRLARDLHDGLGGMLAGVKINLSGTATHIGEETVNKELNLIIHQLDNSVNELRRIARNMMPESLLKFGLETALKDLCESMMTVQTRIDFEAFGIEKSIPVTIQVTIYRIVQEALSNAIRHAEATEVVVQCSQNGNAFFITVEDNGKGFDTGRRTGEGGIGIGNIRNRVEYLKGRMELTSVVNEGTTINIELNVGNER